MKKRFISILLCFGLIAAVFAGCSKSNNFIGLIYPFGGNVKSYDPQVASTADEFLIIENTFEGLVRCNDEGKITPGCAESWQVTDAGLKYTFHLYRGLKWHVFDSVKERMGEHYDPELTAFDFAFALRRAVDPTTESPLYSTVSNIYNAKEINAGWIDKSQLGVKAIDNYTLEIMLEKPDDGFLRTLSTAVAMPCNEEFFNKTNGRYGLGLQYIMFNGQFRVTNELDNSYILKSSCEENGAYKGPTKTTVSNITLEIVDDDESLVEKLKSGYYDTAYIRGYESAEIGNKSGINLVPYSNTTWAFLLNSQNGILASTNARKAIALALSEIDLEDFTYLEKAKGFIPPSCILGNESYTEKTKSIMPKRNTKKAVSLWKKAVEATSNYDIELTVLVPEAMENEAKLLLQGVESSIGSISNADEDRKISFSLKVETKPESEIRYSVNMGDYDIALYPLTATASSPVSFLKSFTDNNLTGFSESKFEPALKKAQSSNTASDCLNCEKKLLSTYCYIPLFYESRYYATAKGISGVEFHPGSGRVNFVKTTQE
ncbi:MAG: hypothetical protein K2K01_08380 [Eubacterium sp.]|nr:hypothetical protein [Eubacterium sp.]